MQLLPVQHEQPQVCAPAPEVAVLGVVAVAVLGGGGGGEALIGGGDVEVEHAVPINLYWIWQVVAWLQTNPTLSPASH